MEIIEWIIDRSGASLVFLDRGTKASAVVMKSSQLSLVGQTEKEGTNVLTKSEKMSRAAAYINRNDEECKILKMQFDTTLQKRVTRCHVIKLMPSNSQCIWLLKMLKDTRTTYNLALGHLLKMNTHKKSAADLNMATIESELQKMFVAKQGVRALHKRHHKLLHTPKVPRQQGGPRRVQGASYPREEATFS